MSRDGVIYGGVLFCAVAFGVSAYVLWYTPHESVMFEIHVDSAGFHPERLSIRAGDSVAWVNDDTESVWPASDLHPTHSLYPGSSIWKCKSAEAGTLFDACEDVPPQGRYTYTFTTKGEWTYHDHLHPGREGIVIVR